MAHTKCPENQIPPIQLLLRRPPFLYAAEIGNQWLLKALVEHGAIACDQLIDGHTAVTLLNG